MENIEEAIENGRLPYLYEGEKEHGPAHCSCAETMITTGEDGDMALKAEYLGSPLCGMGNIIVIPKEKTW